LCQMYLYSVLVQTMNRLSRLVVSPRLYMADNAAVIC